MKHLASLLVILSLTMVVLNTNAQNADTCDSVLECAQLAVKSAIDAREKYSTIVPPGAVMAFALSDCPGGWAGYSKGVGRVIIGSGDGNGMTSRSNGATGGRETIVLNTSDLPKHSHAFSEWHYFDEAAPNSNYATKQGDDTGNIVKKDRVTSETGQGQGISILPPFVALKYCVKI